MLEDNKLFTVIIAVYNDENRIDKCLNSLINQTKLNFNIIVVNDGSTDKTHEHIMDYINKNDNKINIKYINKKLNQGVSSARNDALELAETKYICFLDSDDFFYNDMAENYEKIIVENQFDLYSFNYMTIYSDISKNKEYKSKYLKDKEFKSSDFLNELLMQKNGIYAHCCTKLYKNKIIKDNNIKFEDDISFMEDLIFNLNYTIHCNNALHVNKSWYNYVQSENSLSKSNDERMINNFKDVLNKVLNILVKENIINLHQNEYDSLYNRLVILSIRSIVRSIQPDEIKQKRIDMIYEVFDVENKIKILGDEYYFNELFKEVTKIIVQDTFNLKKFIKILT